MELSVLNISAGYPKDGKANTVLSNVSFTVEQGSLTAVLGSSGVGKSSLLRIAAGLDSPLSGQILLDGQAITQPHPDIAVVFQSPLLLPWLSVWQNVAFGLDFQCRTSLSKAQIQQQVESTLVEVGLADFADKMPHELSGGMAQRVNLARAIARNPKVILLDEPFSALDPITRDSMQKLLHNIVEKHRISALMITHDIDEALSVAEQILLLGKKDATQAAEVVGQWHLRQSFPRDILELNSIRMEILNRMRKPNAIIEYMI